MAGGRFIKGDKRAGRPKGTPNKTAQTIKELMELEEGGTPGPIALWRAGKKAVALGYKADEPNSGLVSAGLGAMGKALSFAYPNLKAVEHTGEIKTIPTLEVFLSPPPQDDAS